MLLVFQKLYVYILAWIVSYRRRRIRRRQTALQQSLSKKKKKKRSRSCVIYMIGAIFCLYFTRIHNFVPRMRLEPCILCAFEFLSLKFGTRLQCCLNFLSINRALESGPNVINVSKLSLLPLGCRWAADFCVLFSVEDFKDDNYDSDK